MLFCFGRPSNHMIRIDKIAEPAFFISRQTLTNSQRTDGWNSGEKRWPTFFLVFTEVENNIRKCYPTLLRATFSDRWCQNDKIMWKANAFKKESLVSVGTENGGCAFVLHGSTIYPAVTAAAAATVGCIAVILSWTVIAALYYGGRSKRRKRKE